MKPIRVLVVDDHSLVREGIGQLLQSEPDIEIIGYASDGKEAIQMAGQLLPDVVLMDIAMPGINGIEATRQIKALYPEVRVVALSMYDYDDYIVEMFGAGALNYVLKTATKQELITAIKTAYAGQSILYPAIATRLVSVLARNVERQEGISPEALTQREKEILKYIAEGYSSQEIASLLKLSARTVQTHRANIMKKLHLHNTAELVRYAIGIGLVKVE